ncbi:MAG: phosphotransferase [Nocardioides sp.]
MDVVADLLAEHWGLDGAELTPLDGGINSATWLVTHRGMRYVAKQVGQDSVADLGRGCEVAATLARSGFVTGRPIPTSAGQLLLTQHGLALLEYVSGRELDGETAEDQLRMGETLAAIHAAGNPGPGLSSATFMADWLDLSTPWVRDHDWLVRAIESARAETDALRLTWTMLHTDPAPEAFVYDDRSGVTALIDWAGAQRGPALYDVASAVMYLGGADHAQVFLTAYLSHSPSVAAEVRHLPAFRRFRGAIQGAYFARRLATGDSTGSLDEAENRRGLGDACRQLEALGSGISSPHQP